MVNYWIIVAKRPGGDLETMREVIDSEIWDFVSSKDSETPITPSYARELRRNDKVLFYISDKDQKGNPLYRYKAFIAHATLDSKFEDELDEIKKFVRLRNINHFRPPVKVVGACKIYKICGGPKTIVPLRKENYDKIVRLSTTKKVA